MGLPTYNLQPLTTDPDVPDYLEPIKIYEDLRDYKPDCMEELPCGRGKEQKRKQQTIACSHCPKNKSINTADVSMGTKEG